MKAEASDINFYKNLPTFKRALPEVFDEGAFTAFAPDWHVIIADVKDSTLAVKEGKHDDVNLISAGCLV